MTATIHHGNPSGESFNRLALEAGLSDDLIECARNAGRKLREARMDTPGPTIHHGDCLDVLRAMPDNSVDAVVCDPPYGLSNTSPDKVTDTIVRWATGDREAVPSTKSGFMGAEWDAFVPPPAVWDECFRVLKPGGHLLAFAGARTQDLMGVSVRMAGFDIRDSISWINGAGFPKSLDISKAIDKAAGAKREVIGSNGTRPIQTSGRIHAGANNGEAFDREDNPITAPATPEAERWKGWGTSLKPAVEPVICARKPLSEKTVAANTLTWGTGGLNIDATRIGTQPAGRWPANVVLDPDTAEALDQQSGNRPGAVSNGSKTAEGMNGTGTFKIHAREQKPGYADQGGASRFFKVCEPDEHGAVSPFFPREFDNAVEPDPPFMYAAKAPKKERPTVKRTVLRLRDDLTPEQVDHVQARLREAGISPL